MWLRALCLPLWLVSAGTAAHSQRIEITPFLGFAATDVADDERAHHDYGRYRGLDDSVDIDDESVQGLSIGFDVTRHTQIELLYSRQRTSYRDVALDDSFDLDLDYLHVGVSYQWTFDRVEPFVVGSVGITRLDRENDRTGGIGNRDDVPSVSGGGGVKVMLSDRLGFRFAARVFVSAIDEDDPLLCPPGACAGDGEEALGQFDLSAGLILRFGKHQPPRWANRSVAPARRSKETGS